MRKDFNKLLCERERPRSKDKFKYYRKEFENANFQNTEDDILGPDKTGPGLVYGWNKKTFNENLNPLWGFISKAAGRKWDDVYSEICKTFDKRSVINQHILEHLKQFVELNTFMQDGEVWAYSGYYGGRPEPVNKGWQYGKWPDYYVHPITGILTKTNKPSKRAQREIKEKENKLIYDRYYKKISHDTEAYKFDDVWYSFKWVPVKTVKYETQVISADGTVKTVTSTKQEPSPWSCMFKQTVSAWNHQQRLKTQKPSQYRDKNPFPVLPSSALSSAGYNPRDGYCSHVAVEKKQLSTKEKKQIGV